MTTFDLADVRRFTAEIGTRLDRCDNGEGMECANLDATLRHYAALCCEFRDGVRAWGRSVFAGRLAFDAETDRTWHDEGARLYARAAEFLADGKHAEGGCYVLNGQTALRSALWGLHQLLTPWVTPKLAVGPAARQGSTLTGEVLGAAQEESAGLPPLPADWRPTDSKQQARLAMFRKS